MSIDEIVAAAAALTTREVLVILAAAKDRLSVAERELGGAPVGAVDGAPPPRRRTAWLPHVVEMRACGPKRALVIMEVRAALSLSFAAAKAVVDAAPCEFATFPDEFAAEAFARALAALGATVTVKVAS